MAPQYRLTYFDNRGAAEPCRLIFAHAGVAYEDKRVSREEWADIKSNYPWGQVPVLEEDGKILAQSSAILRYLGKKYNLAGENDFESAKCDEMVEAVGDMKKAAFAPLFEKDEAKKAELTVVLKSETFPKFFKVFESILEKNGGFLVGKKFTYADLTLASYINILDEHLGGDLMAGHPTLKSHYDSVFAAKGIKDWVAKRPKTQF